MTFAEKFNKRKFEVNTEGFKFIKLKELYEENGASFVYTLLGAYISDSGKFGEAPVLIIDGYLVNAPKHLLEVITEMINDSEVVEMINDGKCGFEIYTYEREGKTCYSVQWEDIEG